MSCREKSFQKSAAKGNKALKADELFEFTIYNYYSGICNTTVSLLKKLMIKKI